MRRVFGKDAGTRLPVGAALVAAGDRIFTSGLLSDHPGGLDSESHRVFQQAVALLRSAGAAPADVVRTRVFYVDEGPSAGTGDAEKALRAVHGVVGDPPRPALTPPRTPRKKITNGAVELLFSLICSRAKHLEE
jgi:enamine deaminase RidA (YjgF/YER057c/UK114 family)